MMSRLHTSVPSPDGGDYDTLIHEATAAFGQDVVYAIQIVESARSISAKRGKKNKTKP